MRKILFQIFFFVFLVSLGLESLGQVTISGPTCVMPGTVYLYNIQGTWDSASTLQVCVSGGKIINPATEARCTGKTHPIAAVGIIWNNEQKGSLRIISTSGNASLHASITRALDGGELNSASKTQAVDNHQIPITIILSPAIGGSCAPSYAYQWQQSADAVSWSDIPGATGQNLNFSATIMQTTYYRRKVTETVSGTIAYSDAAMVDIILKNY